MKIIRLLFFILMCFCGVHAFANHAAAGDKSNCNEPQIIGGHIQHFVEIEVIDDNITANVSGVTPTLSDDKARFKVRSNTFCLVQIQPDGYIRTHSDGVMARAVNNSESIGYEVFVRSNYDCDRHNDYRKYCHPFLVLPRLTRDFSVAARVSGQYTASSSFAQAGNYIGKLLITASIICR